METVKGSRGKCPACGEFTLSYFTGSVEDEKVKSVFNCMRCGIRGTEWCNMQYDHTEWEEKKDADDTA